MHRTRIALLVGLALVGLWLAVWTLGGEAEPESAQADGSVQVESKGTPEEHPLEPGEGASSAHQAPGSEAGTQDRRVAFGGNPISVLNEEGEPVNGAQVRAMPVGPEGGDLRGYLDTVVECDRLFAWEERSSRLESSFHSWVSNVDGEVSIDIGSTGEETDRWLLVVAKPGHATNWQILSNGQLLMGGLVVDLKEDPAVRILVARDGVPVAGATVELQAMLAEDWIPARMTLEQGSRRAIRHTAQTDEEGVATLPSVRGRCRISAKLGDWESLPWVGEPASDVVLGLAPAFGVLGSVRRKDGASLNEWAHVCLSAWDDQRLHWIPCKTVLPNARGEFEGLSAATGAPRYRVQAVLTGARDEFKDLQDPAPGSRQEVHFELAPEAALWITAIDSRDEAEQPESIEGAVFDITWQSFGGPSHTLRARAGGNGYAWVRELPPGAEFSFTATAPGFKRGHFGPHVVLEGEPTVMISMLKPATRQRARVTQDGRPIREFLLRTFRPNSLELRPFETVRADANGEFSIPREGALTQVQAWIPNQGASDWVDLPGERGAEAPPSDDILELEIQPSTMLGGRVVSEASGDPIDDAVLSWRDSRSRSGAGFELPMLARSDSEGRFQIASHNASGGAELMIRAPGYQTLVVDQRAIGTGDLGDLSLGPASVVSLVLADSVQEPPANLGVVGRGFVENEIRYFGAERALAWTPDVGLIQFEIRLGEVHRSPYPRDLSGKIVSRGGRQVIQYVPPSGPPIQLLCRDLPAEFEGSDVVASLEPLSGTHPFSREVLLPAGERRVNLPRLEPGAYSVKLSLAGQGPFARDTVQVSEGTQELEVSGRAGRWSFQIQRADRGPVGSATIYVSGGSQSASVQTKTVDDGWAGVASVDPPRFVSGRFEDGAVFSLVPINWNRVGEETGLVAIGELRSIPVRVDGQVGAASQVTLRVLEPSVGVELARVRTDGSGLGLTPPIAMGRFVVSPASDRLWPTQAEFHGDEPEWRLHTPGFGQVEARVLGSAGTTLIDQTVDVWHPGLGTGSANWIAAGLFSPEDFVTSGDGVLNLPGAPAGWIEVSTNGEEGSVRAWIEPDQTHREDLDWGR